MKKILLAFLFLPVIAFAAKEPKSAIYDAVIIKVKDGDTIAIAAPYLPAPIKPELSVRIYGVDTPEKGHRAQCPKEATMGEQATKHTKTLVENGKKFQLKLYGWDKFGGRILGDIIVDGKSVRESLIQAGLAREYYGEAKKSWCD